MGSTTTEFWRKSAASRAVPRYRGRGSPPSPPCPWAFQTAHRFGCREATRSKSAGDLLRGSASDAARLPSQRRSSMIGKTHGNGMTVATVVERLQQCLATPRPLQPELMRFGRDMVATHPEVGSLASLVVRLYDPDLTPQWLRNLWPS